MIINGLSLQDENHWFAHVDLKILASELLKNAHW